MYEGDGACLLRFYQPDGTTCLYRFSTKFEADGITFEEPNDQMFSFNSPVGACPVCEGFGKVVGIDEHLVIPNRARIRLRWGCGVLARRGDGRMAGYGDMRSRESRFPHLQSLLRADRRTAPDALGGYALLRRNQRFLQDGAGEPIQDTISGDAGTISRQDNLPQVPRHPPET